jgi:hypothetical protein
MLYLSCQVNTSNTEAIYADIILGTPIIISIADRIVSLGSPLLLVSVSIANFAFIAGVFRSFLVTASVNETKVPIFTAVLLTCLDAFIE